MLNGEAVKGVKSPGAADLFPKGAIWIADWNLDLELDLDLDLNLGLDVDTDANLPDLQQPRALPETTDNGGDGGGGGDGEDGDGDDYSMQRDGSWREGTGRRDARL